VLFHTVEVTVSYSVFPLFFEYNILAIMALVRMAAWIKINYTAGGEVYG
jgi:hypothetical protein